MKKTTEAFETGRQYWEALNNPDIKKPDRVANTFLKSIGVLGRDLKLRIRDVGNHQTELELIEIVFGAPVALNTVITLLYSYDTLVAVSKLQKSITGDDVNYPTDDWPIPIKFYKVKLSEWHGTRTTSKHIRQFLERQLDIVQDGYRKAQIIQAQDDRDWLAREAKKLTIEIPIDYAAALTTIEIAGFRNGLS